MSMEIITINGLVLPSPSNMTIGGEDVEGSGTVRNELGVLLRDRIRHNVYRIDLEFKNTKGHEVSLIESAISAAVLKVRFPDSKGYTTKDMYAVELNKNLVTYQHNNFDENRWNLTFGLVEY